MRTLVVLRAECPAGLDAAASGDLADALTRLFVSARDRLGEQPADGGLLVSVRTDEPPDHETVLSAVRAVTRGLAREFAPRRVNALVANSEDERLIRFLIGPAGAMLTGAVYDLRTRCHTTYR